MPDGEIPKQIGNLNKLASSFFLSRNMLTGEIPKQIGNLSKLQENSSRWKYAYGRDTKSNWDTQSKEYPRGNGKHEVLESLDLQESLQEKFASSLLEFGPTLAVLILSYNKLSEEYLQHAIRRLQWGFGRSVVSLFLVRPLEGFGYFSILDDKLK
nr:receptor-like protein kinase HSL1 [Ipomoea batatas]